MLEVHPDKAALVSSLFNQAGVPCSIIGSVLPEQTVDIKVAGQAAISGNTAALRWVHRTVLSGNVCLILFKRSPRITVLDFMQRALQVSGVVVLACSCRDVWKGGQLCFAQKLESPSLFCSSAYHHSSFTCRDVWEQTSFAYMLDTMRCTHHQSCLFALCICRDVWEETSFTLERLQAAEECVDQEQAGLKSRTAPTWKLPFTPAFTPADKMSSSDKVSLVCCFRSS